MHTEDFPPLAETFSICSVDDVHDSMAIVVIPMPDITNTRLATEVEELQDRRGQRDFSHCM